MYFACDSNVQHVFATKFMYSMKDKNSHEQKLLQEHY